MKRVIGHRGASAHAPENTIASFEEAKKRGCVTIEFDVMLSADGDPFVFHDETLKRTTNGRGKFGEVKTTYIQSLDAGHWFSKRFRGEVIPSLADALDWFNHSGMHPNIEIKPYPGTTEQTAAATLMCINQHWPTAKVLPLVSSFDIKALTFCRNLSPELPLGLLLDKWVKEWHTVAHDLQCYSVHISKNIATEKRIKEIKSHGYQVYVYTVNRKWRARKLLKWGVDALFSDHPERIGSI